MAKGGFTGATPPRETSPEEYSGVWDITEQYGEQKVGSWPFQADDCAPKSLRFDGSSSNLEKTFAASGNRTAWSWSCWLKRGRMDLGRQVVFGSYNAANDDTWLEFGVDNTNAYYTTNSIAGSSSAALRDPAAFYHYFANFDGATFKIFINNVEVLSSTSLAGTRGIAGPYRHRIGQSPASHAGNIRYFDGVMAECHFIDGQVLSPSDFAFYDGQGIWQPKRFTGDYSSGPVYSNFLTSTGPGSINSPTATFDGNTGTRSVGSSAGTTVVFTPQNPLTIANKLRVFLYKNSSSDSWGTFTINGNTVDLNALGATHSAWYDFGSTYTQLSSMSWENDNGSNVDVRVAAIEIDGVILRDASVGRNSFHLDFSDGVKDHSGLGNDWATNNVIPFAGENYLGGFTGTERSGFEWTKVFDGDLNQGSVPSANTTWTWTPSSSISFTTLALYAYKDSSPGDLEINGTSVISQIPNHNGVGPNQRTVITGITSPLTSIKNISLGSLANVPLAAIEIDGQILYDASLSDLFVDSPVNGKEASTGAGGERRGNYATLTPLTGAQTLTNGNLDVTGGSSWQRSVSTIAMSSGKWYWEYKITASNEHLVGVGPLDMQMSGNLGAGSPPGSGYGTELGQVNGTGANSSWNNTGGSTAGDVIGIAFDADAGKMYVYKNGTALNSGAASHTGLTNGPYFAVFSLNGSTRSGSVNFGQRQFKYQNAGTDRPSSDYKPLATSFLLEPSELAKNPSKAFDILLWSGSGLAGDRAITGIDMESGPDMVWSKTRNHGYHHNIFDAVRGFGASGGAPLTTDYVASQANAGAIKSTDSTSITWEKDSSNGYVWYNESGKNYVSWLWDAGTATTTVAAGGSNSLAYNQSQTWSTAGTITGSAWPDGNSTYTGVFNGGSTASAAANNYAFAAAGSTYRYTFPSNGLSVSSYVKVYYWKNGGTLRVNAGQSDEQSITASTSTYTSTTYTSSTISVLKNVEVETEVNTGPYLIAIEVDGKMLVDSGVTVTNVPQVECKVRANPEAGFSIVKVDSPDATETRVHGLSKAPDFIIAKAIASSNTQHYHMFHSHFGKSHYATFTGDAWASSDQWGSQEPNASTFFVKANTGSGANYAGGMIYYIWHAVENYSAMGSYVGNGSNDGPMVHLGFEPKWVMVKGASGSTFWRIWDAEREPNNSKSLTFSPNSALDENQWSADGIDFLSNGFKIRSTGSYHNNQFQTYVYVAFAANPFAHARAH